MEQEPEILQPVDQPKVIVQHMTVENAEGISVSGPDAIRAQESAANAANAASNAADAASQAVKDAVIARSDAAELNSNVSALHAGVGDLVNEVKLERVEARQKDRRYRLLTRAVAALMLLVFAEGGVLVFTGRENHSTLSIVRQAVDPNSKIGKAGAQNAVKVEDRVILCVNAYTAYVVKGTLVPPALDCPKL